MFEIYLDDKVHNQYTKLDTDATDFSTTFAVSDINDISKRKDAATKDLTLPGTARNNKAFGYAFMVTKYNDDNDDVTNGTLFFNYNPQVLVDAYIYENGALLMKGSLRLLNINLNANNVVSYDCVITGDLIDFRGMLADKLLTDLDLSEMTHTFSLSSILYNWNNDPLSQGYVYPLIHNGMPFLDTTSVEAATINPFQIRNFKPAVFVSKILDKIFADSNILITTTTDNNIDTEVRTVSGLAYNWRVDGSVAFKTMFNNLIIPNNQLNMGNPQVLTGSTQLFSMTNTAGIYSDSALLTQESDGFGLVTLLNDVTFGTKTDTLNLFTVGGFFSNNISTSHPYGKDLVVYNVNRTFKAAGTLTTQLIYTNLYGASKPIQAKFTLWERNVVAESNQAGYRTAVGWDEVASDVFLFASTSSTGLVRNFTLAIPERTYQVGRQIRVTFSLYSDYATTGINFVDKNGNLDTAHFTYQIPNVVLQFPNQVGATIVTNVNIGDTIIPTLPTGVKQLDFINSLRNIFNFYVWTDQDTRIIVFEQYNDYYANTKGLNLVANALDWTRKIDLTSRGKITTNTTIQKFYNFTMKSDSDYINDFYQKKYGQTYGDYSVTDALGISETPLAVDVIFSPTPLVLAAPNITGQGGLDKAIPWIYTLDSNGNVFPLDTNIRILNYNGIADFTAAYNKTPITIITEIFNPRNNSYSHSAFITEIAAMVSNFVTDSSGNPVSDIHFGSPNETYIIKSATSVPTSYANYRNQILELKNPNVNYFDCEAYLNENDIANLDLSVPIFIDLGMYGASYWKLLSVDYTNNGRTSSIKLQKVLV
ncbi:hypothetical protein [Pedobacter sp. L105]|uniref:hypothetical protein n=1 Tax=Pedobacter sp. L105 TaxID=1641871 RepID=UPI00131CF93A|nr:hypothetical protein [Pedobacter sp. L105]